MAKPKRQYPEILVELADTLAALLVVKGLDEETADDIAMEVTERARKVFGGQLIYLPKGDLFNRSERDDEIYRKFDGQNAQQLAAEYGLSQQHIYRVIRRIRRESMATMADRPEKACQ